MDILAIEVAGGDAELLAQCLQKLARLRILHTTQGGDIRFLKFEDRQYDKPSDKPEAVKERVSLHRARQRDAEAATEDNLPVIVTDEPALKRDVTPCNAHTQKILRSEDTQKILRTEQNILLKRPITIDPLLSAGLSSDKAARRKRAAKATPPKLSPVTATLLDLGNECEDEGAGKDGGADTEPCSLMASLRRAQVDGHCMADFSPASPEPAEPMESIGTAVNSFLDRLRAMHQPPATDAPTPDLIPAVDSIPAGDSLPAATPIPATASTPARRKA